MTDSLSLAAVVAGGLTAIGLILDWGVSPETKKAIQDELERRLFKFRYTSMRTFGRDEIGFSMRVFDLFGRRLLSWQRLAAVIVTYALLMLIALLLWQFDEKPRGLGLFGWHTAIVASVNAVFFAFSISLTMWLSNLWLRMPGGATLAGAIALMVTHLVLLFLWRPFVETMVNEVTKPLIGIQFTWQGASQNFVGMAEAYARNPLPNFENVALLSEAMGEPKWVVALLITDIIAPLLANGLRIGLAMVFILGHFYIQYLRPSLIWFWSALIRSPALFSPPASALAAIILVFDKRNAILGALTRPFQ